MRRLFQLICLLLILQPGLGYHVQAQTKVLFVGNSYTYFNDMPDMVSRLANLNGREIEASIAVNGGVSLKDHWDGNSGLETKATIQNGDFDFVILQDQSMTPIHSPGQTIAYGEKLAKLIQSKGGTVIIFQTWSRKNTPDTQAKLDDTFSKLAKGINAKVAPVARAWHLAIEEYPKLELYDLDGSHPSEIGSYLTALVIYKTLFDLKNLENLKTFKSTRWPVAEMKQSEWIAHTAGEFE